MTEIRVEFTVEPFVDNHPGPHVRAAWQAAEARGCEPVLGPFSTEVTVADGEQAAELVADVVRAALGAGATHVAVHVERVSAEGAGDRW